MDGIQPRSASKAAGFKVDGLMRGPGPGTSDSIHKKVPEGNYIMPADSTAQLGPLALPAPDFDDEATSTRNALHDTLLLRKREYLPALPALLKVPCVSSTPTGVPAHD